MTSAAGVRADLESAGFMIEMNLVYSTCKILKLVTKKVYKQPDTLTETWAELLKAGTPIFYLKSLIKPGEFN